ncbi:MAG: hypothetical protein IJW81_08055 [Clostridia bacterium]|nr:hypothetical protein [Clostridia bacterium]
MKKFLSLALALLMMLPLAIGTSAASSDIVTPIELYKALGYFLDDDDNSYYKYLSNNSMPLYCSTCKKTTYWVHGVDKDGDVYRECSKCDTVVYTKQTLENIYACKYCDCFDCNRFDRDCDCCTDCVNYDSGMMVYPEYNWKDQFYHSSSCTFDELSFVSAKNGFVWICNECGKSGYVSYSDWDDDWDDYFWDYDITVSCGRGGDYSIDGRHVANYGDTRTITFEPDYGYVLYYVTVNGESYGAATKLELTVTKDLYIRATFVKASTLKPCTFTTTVIGNGEIKALKNSKVMTSDTFTALYGDTVSFKFIGANDNYVVKNVVINGVSKGAIKSYSINTKITKDVDIKVTFEWKSPYSDVADNYLNAVEYVTEAGIMGYYNQYVNKNAFGGTKEISVKSLAAALAEMADVNEKLDTVNERIEWAEKNGIIDGDADLSVLCKVQDACDIVNAFLTVLEDEGDVDFEDFDDDDTAKENALEIGLVSEKTYKSNRNLTRYDLASICYLIVNLDVE